MDVKDAQQDWDAFARSDALWAILTEPGKRGRWQSEEFFQTGVREVDKLLAYLHSLGVGPRRGRALDFGCGVGRLTQALCAHFEEVHGVDVAPSMIELANHYNKHGGKCMYHVNDRPALHLFTDVSFDLVYSSITLQHIEPKDSIEYIREFARVLVHGGVLVFQLPAGPRNHFKALAKRGAAKALLRLFRATGYVTRPIMVMHGVDRAEVLNLLETARLKIIDVSENTDAGEDWISYRYVATKP